MCDKTFRSKKAQYERCGIFYYFSEDRNCQEFSASWAVLSFWKVNPIERNTFRARISHIGFVAHELSIGQHCLGDAPFRLSVIFSFPPFLLIRVPMLSSLYRCCRIADYYPSFPSLYQRHAIYFTFFLSLAFSVMKPSFSLLLDSFHIFMYSSLHIVPSALFPPCSCS
jgi:hypothetical protein